MKVELLKENTGAGLDGFSPQRAAARPRARWIPNLGAVTFWQRPLRNPSSHTNRGAPRASSAPSASQNGSPRSSPVSRCRGASAAEEESFENDLERQLEDELSLEELLKHRQEPDSACMVRLRRRVQR